MCSPRSIAGAADPSDAPEAPDECMDDAPQPACGDAVPGARILGLAEGAQPSTTAVALPGVSSAGCSHLSSSTAGPLVSKRFPILHYIRSCTMCSRRQRWSAAPQSLPGDPLALQPGVDLSPLTTRRRRPTRSAPPCSHVRRRHGPLMRVPQAVAAEHAVDISYDELIADPVAGRSPWCAASMTVWLRYTPPSSRRWCAPWKRSAPSSGRATANPRAIRPVAAYVVERAATISAGARRAAGTGALTQRADKENLQQIKDLLPCLERRLIMPPILDPMSAVLADGHRRHRHRLYFEEAGQGIPLVCLHTPG